MGFVDRHTTSTVTPGAARDHVTRDAVSLGRAEPRTRVSAQAARWQSVFISACSLILTIGTARKHVANSAVAVGRGAVLRASQVRRIAGSSIHAGSVGHLCSRSTPHTVLCRSTGGASRNRVAGASVSKNAAGASSGTWDAAGSAGALAPGAGRLG
jgi:hypothetical protein